MVISPIKLLVPVTLNEDSTNHGVKVMLLTFWYFNVKFKIFVFDFKDRTPALTKSMNMGIWVVGASNQFFVRGS